MLHFAALLMFALIAHIKNLLKGAFLYSTGACGSVYSQTCRISLLVLFYYLGLRIEIVCR